MAAFLLALMGLWGPMYRPPSIPVPRLPDQGAIVNFLTQRDEVIAGLILDQATRIAAPMPAPADMAVDLGPETNLGPGALNLSAMAALDATIAGYSALVEADLLADATQSSVQGTYDITPFDCDLPALAAELTSSLSGASSSLVSLWEDALNARGINDFRAVTQADSCGQHRAYLDTLAHVMAEAARPCSLINEAMGLLDLLANMPPATQVRFSRDLSLLAQRQDDLRFRGQDPYQLCEDYQALAQTLNGAI